MECFNGFWSRRVDTTHPDLLSLAPSETCRSKTYRWYLQYIVRKQSTDIDQVVCETVTDTPQEDMEDFEHVKQIIKNKAEKHAGFYRNLLTDREEEKRHLDQSKSWRSFQNEHKSDAGRNEGNNIDTFLQKGKGVETKQYQRYIGRNDFENWSDFQKEHNKTDEEISFANNIDEYLQKRNLEMGEDIKNWQNLQKEITRNDEAVSYLNNNDANIQKVIEFETGQIQKHFEREKIDEETIYSDNIDTDVNSDRFNKKRSQNTSFEDTEGKQLNFLEYDYNKEDFLKNIKSSPSNCNPHDVDFKKLAAKSSEYYINLENHRHLPSAASSSDLCREVSTSSSIQTGQSVCDPANVADGSSRPRQRRTGVVQMHQEANNSLHAFPSVEKFIQQYTELINQQMDRLTDGKTQTLLPPSGYSSSSNNSDDERCVKTCCSSDSALGLQSDIEASEEQDLIHELSSNKRGSIDHFSVPSKTLIEAQYVQFPLDRKFSDCESVEESEKFSSRRQSCFTDDGEDQPRYRVWRTPSVVVSDYSDDVIGGSFISYEELEYFRNHRKDVSSPDSSLNSSCSNLNYCGSSVSVLDAEYTLRTPVRKQSDCSTCSTVSGDDEIENHLQPLTSTVYGNKLEKDAKNFMMFKTIGSRLLMKEDAVPHLNTNIDTEERSVVDSQISSSSKKRKGENVTAFKSKKQLNFEGFEDLVQELPIANSVGIQVDIKKETRDVQVYANIKIHHIAKGHLEKTDSPTTSFSSTTSATTTTEFSTPGSATSTDSLEEAITDKLFKDNCCNNTIRKIQSNSRFYLGLPQTEYFLVNFLSENAKVIVRNIMICLKKIRLNDQYVRIGVDFGISGAAVGKIFTSSLSEIANVLQEFVYWPDIFSIKYNLPTTFIARYKNVVSIIDCLEIQIEHPTNAVHQAQTWSTYKKCNTIKYLISATPSGLITFISEGYGGRASDKQIVEQSSYLKELPNNCTVMADRGFKQLETLLKTKNCTLVRPPSVKTGEKISKQDVLESKRIAALRIHIERVIRRLREFEILKPHACINKDLVAWLNYIIIIVCGIVNVQGPLIK